MNIPKRAVSNQLVMAKFCRAARPRVHRSTAAVSRDQQSSEACDRKFFANFSASGGYSLFGKSFQVPPLFSSMFSEAAVETISR